MVKRSILALVAGVVVGCVVLPVLYYRKTAPQRAVLASLATETEADMERWGKTATISKSDYEETMKRSRVRDERHRQVIAEKIRIRSRARQIAIISGFLTAVLVFGFLPWISKRRRSFVDRRPEPDPPG